MVDAMEASPLALPDLIRTVEERAGDEPLERLQAATEFAGELGDVADQLLDHFVGEARKGGCSWAQIGERFGVSKQAAQQRFVSGHRGAPFRNFGEEARAVIVKAQEEARELGHGRVGTEHLLLGVLAQGERPGIQALATLGVTAEAARARVADVVPRRVSAGHGIRFMPRAKRVIGMSMGGSRWMGHEEVLPEHLLLAMLRDRESGGAQIVSELAAHEDVRGKVLEALFPEGVPEWVAKQGPPPWAHRRRRGRSWY
jgi:hypothetical protein